MLDASLIKFLSADDAAEMRDMEVIFGSKGWTRLEEKFKEDYETAKNAALAASTWEENRLAMGRLGYIVQMLKLEEYLETAYEQRAMEAQSAAEQAKMDEELEYE